MQADAAQHSLRHTLVHYPAGHTHFCVDLVDRHLANNGQGKRLGRFGR